MLVMRLVALFIFALQGLIISYIFALVYAHVSSLAGILSFSVVAAVIWIRSLLSPVGFPFYKGILPALFPMIGLLLSGLFGFAIGWFLAGLCECITDFRRYDSLSEITGGAPAAEIIPLQAVGILLAGFAVGILFANQECPVLQSGEEFLATFTYRFFLKGLTQTSGTQQLVDSISLIGGGFVGTQHLFFGLLATLFPRPQIPRIP